MSLRFKKIIVRLRMWYAKFRGHKGHRWITNHLNGTWVDITKTIRRNKCLEKLKKQS